MGKITITLEGIECTPDVVIVPDPIPDPIPDPAPDPAPLPPEVTQITLSAGGQSVTFDNGLVPFYFGSHADGSQWIAPKTTLSLSMTGTYALSAQSNPSNPALQAVLNAENGWSTYSAADDISLNPWSPTLPVTSVVVGVELDETIRAPGTTSITGRAMGVVFVLTVYDAIPANNGADRIRPHITSDTKTINLISDFTFPTDARFTATQAEIDLIAERWLHQTEVMRQTDNGEVSWAMRSHLIFDDTYGTGVTRQFSDDLALLLGGGALNTVQAWAAMMAYGGDCYKAFYADQSSDANGGAGQSLGVAGFPAHLFAALQNDKAARDFLAAMPSKPGQEFTQINKASPSHPAVWGDTLPNHEIQYLASMQARGCFAGSNIPCNGSGKKVARDPYGFIDGPPSGPGKAYMVVTGGQYRAIAGAMMAIPDLCTAYNKPELIEYANRIKEHGAKALPDPVAPPDPREPTGGNLLNNPDALLHTAISTSAISNDITWGPDPYEPLGYVPNNSVCTDTGTALQWAPSGSTTQNGRFPHLDGNQVNYTRTSPQWESNFAALFATHTCS